MKTLLRLRWLGTLALVSTCAIVMAQDQAPPIPPRPPRLVMGRIGTWVRTPTAQYRVVGVKSGQKSYKQQFNQDHRKLHPGFGSDRLAVVELEIQNLQDRPIFPPVFMAALVASDGARTTDFMLDARQQSFLEESGRLDRRGGHMPAEIGANQIMKVALIFSVSAEGKPTSLEFAPENFRDMPFGQPGRFRPGTAGTAPPDGQLGPRPAGPRMPPMDAVRVVMDLTTRGRS